jgi:hypothetical protein
MQKLTSPNSHTTRGKRLASIERGDADFQLGHFKSQSVRANLAPHSTELEQNTAR